MSKDEFAELYGKLYGDLAFARRLAAGLVGEGASEDVWQDAWRVVLERPPRPHVNLRGYLATVVRRLAAHRRRRDEHRRERELDVARGELLPSSAELAERMEIHRGVVDALLALEEPYQRAILLVFFEDLSPAEIARREGIPLETVRTRLKRGLARLRARLERKHGGESHWLGGLVALSGPRASARTVESSRTFAVGAGAALVMTGIVAWVAWRPWTGRTPGLATSAAEHPASADALLQPREARASDRTSIAEPTSSPTPAAPVWALRGRVLDEKGVGIAGAEITLRIAGAQSLERLGSARTDERGSYACSVPALTPRQIRMRMLEIEACAGGFQPRKEELPLEDLGSSGLERELVLSSGRTLAGRVLDEGGNPVVSAYVRARFARSASAGAEGATRTALTDLDGAYRLGFEPELELTELEAWHIDVGSAALSAHELQRSSGDSAPAPDLVLLERAVVRGRALHPDGSPASDLSVVAFRVQEDEQGRFSLAPVAPLTAGGLTRGKASTDENGRFAMPGLREGRYACGPASSPPSDDAERGLPEEGLVRAGEGGEEAQVLVLPHRVLLEVVGPDGDALEDVAVACTPLRSTASGWEANGKSTRSLTHGPRGRAAFTAVPGSTLALTVVLPGWTQEDVLDVPELPFELVHRVVLLRSAPSGALRIRYPGAGESTAGCELHLTTDLARIPGFTGRVDAEGLVRGVPCGRFLVEVVPPDECLAPIALPDPIEILPGGTTEIELSPLRGGRLTLLFQLPGEASAREAGHGSDSAAWMSWYPEPIQARLWHAEDPPSAPAFLELSGAAPGTRWTSEHALPAGSYRLEAHFDGFEPIRQWLAVEPCRVPDILVPLTESALTEGVRGER